MKFGLIGLINAAKRFDKDRGIAFSTFAIPTIRNEIYAELRKEKANSRKINNNAMSLSTPLVEGEDNTALENCIPDDFDMDEHIIKNEEIISLHRAISFLKPKEQLILKYYFINDLNQKTIGKLIGVQQSQISRIIKNSINKLRTYMRLYK